MDDIVILWARRGKTRCWLLLYAFFFFRLFGGKSSQCWIMGGVHCQC